MSPSDQLPLTVGRLLQARSRTRADHPFLVCDDRTLTYAELAERSAALARGLIASGLGAGSRLGLIYPNGPELAVAAFAAARIGAIAVPLSTFSTYLELRTLLLNADVDTVIACAGYRSHDYVETLSAAVPKLDLRLPPPLYSPVVPTLRRVVVDSPPRPDVHPAGTLGSVLLAGDRVDGQVLRALQEHVQPSDRLVIVHTSGSTADPKGVIHTHGALVNHLHVLNGIRRFTEGDVLFCNSPFFWIGGYAYALLATLESGGTLVCSNADKPSRVLDLIEHTRPTMVNGFAQAVAHLPKDPTFARRDLSSIKKGNLYPIMSEDVRPVDPELRHNMLGMTETGSVCLASEDETDQPERRRGSFGRLVPGFEGMIAGDSGAVQTVGEVGELWLRGPALMDGYCGKERHETFDRDGWYHTGDLFSMDGDGFFYFKGRSGEMIKTSGANVSPREVEAAILEETGLVSHAFGLDDPSAGQRVVAVVRVPANITPPDPDLLTSRLRGRLSAYKVPKQLLVIDDDDVPIMSSGKVDIRVLKERAHAG